jgi:RsiW-degrading membrane proteinase PrsW (M82 family)
MHSLIALLPVLVFLAALWLMDTFKLVRRTSIVAALTYGALAAVACEAFHGWALTATGLDVRTFSRYVAPFTEESAKAMFVALLIARRRVGFLVDAAVLGFAVGTGFAIVENVTYLRDLRDAPLMLWAVRGLGTGVLHGATTAIAAIAGKAVADRYSRSTVTAFAPGMALAIAIHSAYNHLLAWPVVAAVAVLVSLPIVVVAVFERSERATREWVGAGLDLDLGLLQLVLSEGFQTTRFGAYLRTLPSHFDRVIVADMFCLLRIELELAVQAKARLIAREAGLEIPVDDDLHDALSEWAYLRDSIGPIGLLALEPLRVTSYRDDWHRHLLSQAGLRERLRRRFRMGRAEQVR